MATVVHSSAQQSQLLYSQSFTYPDGTGSTNTVSLNTAYGTTGQTTANELANGFADFFSSTATDGSQVIGDSAIGDRQTPGASNGIYGILIMGGGINGPDIIASTPTGLSIDPTQYNSLTISFKQGDTNSSDNFQLAILSGGQWYVTTTMFSTPAQGAGQFATNSSSLAVAQSYVFNPAAANFKLLGFTPGTTLAQGGTPGSALSGHITGIGFYTNSTPSGNDRFASLQITGVPIVPTQTNQIVTNADWNSAFPSTPVSNGTYYTVPGLATTAPGSADPVGVNYSSTILANDNAGTNTFAGGSLGVVGDTRLLLKQQPGDTASANLVLSDQSNVVLATNVAGTSTLAGTIVVPAAANAYLGLNNSGATVLNVTSTLTGSGTLNLGIAGGGIGSEALNLSGNLSGFAGTINVYTGGSFSLNSSMVSATLSFANTTGSFALNNPISVGNLFIGTTSVPGGTYTAAQLNSLAGVSLFNGSASLSVTNSQVSDGRLALSMSSSGTYKVTSSVTGWSLGGVLPNPPTQLASSSGSDSVGAYQQVSFSWLDASSRSMTGSMKLYSGQDVVIYSDTLVAASAGSPSPFPNFTTLPQGLSKFCYSSNAAFAPPAFNLQGSGSMPWVLFDSSANTIIISPASHFLPSTILGDGTTQIASGFNSSAANFPAGFAQQTIVAVSKGINHTFNNWGLGLTNLYGKTRPANDVDTVLRYYGFWTDAGANYYYNYNMNATASGESAYGATLGSLVANFNQASIPVHYMQLDSWWYDKSTVYWDGSYAGPKSGLPNQDWANYGGALNWIADDYLFPSGLPAFSQYLGNQASSQSSPPAMALVCHDRFIDTTNTLPSTPSPSVNPTFYAEYGNTYANDFAGLAGISSRFWNDRAAYAKANGIQLLEHDWLYDIVAGSPTLLSTPNLGDEFLNNMSAAFAAQGIDIQYCQTLPATVLQASELNNITSARTSNDRFQSGNYHDFLYGSRLASSIGIWPWCDVFNSTELQNLLLDTLSAGPVGTGDAQGNESASNLFLAIRKDGVIVKPDLPLVPTDNAFITEAAAGQNAGAPLTASTTSNNGVTTTYAVAFPQSNSSTSTLTLSMTDLGITKSSYFYNYFSGTATLVAPGGTLSAPVDSGGVSYYIIAPVGQSGIAFLGDLGKIVSNGKKRIPFVSDQPGSLAATILFSPTESQVTLHGYSAIQPVVTVQGGSASAVSYNGTTGHFTVAITVSGSTPLNNDVDPARNVIATFYITPAAPTNLSATANSGNQVTLQWTDNSNDETSFEVQRATNSTFTSGLQTFTAPAATMGVGTYVDTGLASDTTYYYRVYSTNGAGTSASAASVSTTTPDPSIDTPVLPWWGLTALAAFLFFFASNRLKPASERY